MGLRLVLVGMVAGLGLTLPSSGELDRWTRQSQAWMRDLFADRSIERPVDADAYVLIPEPVAAPATPASAPAPTLASVPAPASTPLVDQTNPIASSPASALDAPSLPMPLLENDAVASAPTPEVAAPTAPDDEPFLLAQRAVLDAFAAPTVQVSTPDARELLALVEAIAAADQDRRFASAQEATLSSFAAEALALAPKIKPEPEPLDVGENLYEGVAYALNREAEGLNLPPSTRPTAPAVAAESIPRDGRLIQAVRLTREAAYAWASLISTPAVVTITH